ncbi:retrovirus-related pol polyprotein from transposon TNT 1-94 [Tanacetum coccineum]|uniref:Retrovirus-related pol polyprotein from transposon TNT 1-94 n=1 Tax=Tanacetum coccineum TaxID=301880 RepID=A0ABQ5J1C5_9ASTR
MKLLRGGKIGRLIEAARTMLADSSVANLLFWAEAFSTACSYHLGVLRTILNTIDHLGKFDGKADEGFFVGYSLNSKAFRVFNSRTRIVKENLHIRFSESTPNVVGTQSNGFAGTKASDNADPKSSHDDGSKPLSDDGKKVDEDPRKDSECKDQEKEDNVNSTNNVNTTDYSIFDFTRDDEDDGAEADMKNLDITIQVKPILTIIIYKDHPLDQVIRDLQSATQTRQMSKNLEEYGRTQKGNSCIEGSKLDRGYTGRASTIQVTSRYTQEEGIDCDEVFGLVARIEAIRLFLAYASFKDFVVYQMDVKSAFLYGKIEEEVYVCQPLGFEDPDFPDRVYKVEKALYGLHQAPRAWYETLSTYLLDNGFQRGKIDKTLFIKRHKGDILLVQVYVDDIIFGSTKKELCNAFEKLMHEKFQMSSMGELTFFLGLQVQQKKGWILLVTCLRDENGEEVDVHMYRSMIGSLMYLTSSRPDIMFAVCACARYQVNLKVSHLHAVKRIFRYLKGQPKLGLWYPKDSPFDLVAYTDSDYARASLDRKSTTGGKAKKSIRLMMKKMIGMEFELMLVKTVNWEVQLQALVDGKKIIITESTMRRDLQLKDAEGVDYEAVYKELDDSLVRAATTTSSLEAEQDSGNINKTRSKATPNESSSLGTTSGGGLRCQETMGDTIAQTRFENVSKLSNDPLVARGNTLQSGEDSLKLKELMELYTNLKIRVLDLEKIKTTQAEEIVSLKRRVNKLKQKKRSRTHGLKRLYKVGPTARVESFGDEESLGKDASKQSED